MEITAPSHWRCVDFISDLHLHESDPATFEQWRAYLMGTQADALFILGDLFEVWVGDDSIGQTDGFEARCVQALHAVAQRLDLHIMVGNRDFLMGPGLMQACNAVALDDPSVLVFGGQRILLTHGDALCLGDTDYQQFRKMVRSSAWQTDFLAKPLAQRQAAARAMRTASESRKDAGAVYADVDTPAAVQFLDQFASMCMVHGHTHLPATHDLGHGKSRIVLSDWVAGAQPERGDVLRLQTSKSAGLQVARLHPATASSSAD